MVRRTIAVFAMMAALSACAGADPVATPAKPAQVAEGARLAQAYCAACHAIAAEGASPRAEAPPFRALAARYEIGALEEAFAEGVLTGHPAMPEFRFEPDQIDALLSYIESVQAQGAG